MERCCRANECLMAKVARGEREGHEGKEMAKGAERGKQHAHG
jgi:hypothetical protein